MSNLQAYFLCVCIPISEKKMKKMRHKKQPSSFNAPMPQVRAFFRGKNDDATA